MKRITLLLILFIYSLLGFTQGTKAYIDSLINILPTIKSDSHKVEVLNSIAWDISYEDFQKGIDYSYKALILAKKINYEPQISRAYNCLGTIYADMGLHEDAIKFHLLALELNKKNNSPNGVASSYANISIVYANMENFEIAKNYLILARNQFDSLKSIMNRIKIDYALFTTYSHLNMPDSANYYLEEAFESADKVKGNTYMEATLYYHLSERELNKENYSDAILYLMKSEKLYEELLSSYDLFSVNHRYAEIYIKQEKYPQAISYLNKALDKYGANSTLSGKGDVYNRLSQCYSTIGEYQKAFDAQAQYMAIKDSIRNEKNQNRLIAMENKFKNEKSQLELENLKNLNQLQSAEIQKQNTQKIALGIGLLLMLALVFFIFRGYNQKKRANELITSQKQEVEKQKVIVEEKNKEILDSIAYAKRLQDAILPPSEVIKSTFNNSLIFYKPKDIVAGDFYWMQKAKDEVLFAVADCTGHGVPGAMVSIVCSNALNRTVKEFNITQPAQILDKVSELVEENFSTNESNVQDGMDISLCKLNFQTLSLEYAGAQNPVWIIRNNELLEYKADKQPIGKYTDRRPFTNHTIQLEKNDTLFLFSDGYADQFGGDNGKKLKTSNLKKILCSIQEVDMEKQLEFIKMNFERWKGDLEQVDDVCIMGIKI